MRTLLLLLALLTPIQQAPGEEAPLPELPRITFDGFDAAVRSAIEEAYQNLLREPKDSRLNGRLGMLLQAYEENEKAAACYRRAHQLDPSSFDWVYLLALVELDRGLRDQAIEHLRRAVERRPGYRAARIRLGDALLGAGAVAEAAETYESVLRDDPGSWLAHYGLGQVLLARREPRAAVPHLERAASAPGGFGSAHYALALAYRDLGRREEARAQLERYKKLQNRWPASGDTLLDSVRALKSGPREVFAEGVRLARLGRFKEAIREHERALEMEPDLVQAHVNLIRLFGELQQYKSAEQHYRKMLELNPRQPEGHYNFGVLCADQGRVEEAATAFRRAIELNPHYALAHNNLGFMLERQGHVGEASRHYREAVRNDPSYRLARFNLGRMLLASGKTEAAIGELEKTLSPEDGQTPRFLFALSAAYVRAGELEQARERARSAREMATRWGQKELAQAIEKDLQRLEKALNRP